MQRLSVLLIRIGKRVHEGNADIHPALDLILEDAVEMGNINKNEREGRRGVLWVCCATGSPTWIHTIQSLVAAAAAAAAGEDEDGFDWV